MADAPKKKKEEKNLMRSIGETMEKIFYKKPAPKPAVTPPVTPPVPETQEGTEVTSPWLKATDLDRKMKKKLKEAGAE